VVRYQQVIMRAPKINNYLFIDNSFKRLATY